MKTRIWENQSTLVFDGDITKDEAIERALSHHLRKTDRYHEIYRLDPELGWIGIAQWKPGDCEHYRPKEGCSKCSGLDTKGDNDEM